ncbi:MAG: DNA metabolism protein [Flavobacteriaceae bacterium]|nr:DNA metabolism protein [Flavobacteriaceae bacterium]
MTSILIYDASFEGFLTCIFQIYEQRLNDVSIQKKHSVQNSIFGSTQEVNTNKEQADRVWNGIKKRIGKYGQTCLTYCFLSEKKGCEDLLYRYIQDVFRSKYSIEKNITNNVVLEVSKIMKSVGREKHRMEAFVRFKLTKDTIYFANIEPDFNVLPLIIGHFKKRYADQRWIIYDSKRDTGVYYNLKSVTYVTIEFERSHNFTKTNSSIFTEEEIEFQQLWRDYFKSTNIPARKNMRLHVKHVPKRYWKFLSEKTPND